MRPSAALLLVLTGVLYLWNLEATGYANSFYAAAIQAGTKDWTALLFGSLDAGNAITVDKPPAALWIPALAGRIFGFSALSMLVPEALMGVAAVGVLYLAVKRVSGPAAGLIAGGALALTPVAALMFRFNNPDAMLTLCLVLAAYLTTRAIEKAGWKWLAAAGAVIGLAFLTKMLQGFLIVPGLALAYLWAAPATLGRRLLHLLAAAGGILVVAGSYLALFQLTPASARPYMAGSETNSFLELTFGYNGLGRITGSGGGMPGGGNGGNAGGPGGNGNVGFGGAAGIARMFGTSFGGEVSWLLPAALVLLAAGLWFTRRDSRTSATRAALLLWGGWLVVTAGILELHGRHGAPVLRGGAGPGGRCPDGHWLGGTVAGPGVLAGTDCPGRHHTGHLGLVRSAPGPRPGLAARAPRDRRDPGRARGRRRDPAGGQPASSSGPVPQGRRGRRRDPLGAGGRARQHRLDAGDGGPAALRFHPHVRAHCVGNGRRLRCRRQGGPATAALQAARHGRGNRLVRADRTAAILRRTSGPRLSPAPPRPPAWNSPPAPA